MKATIAIFLLVTLAGCSSLSRYHWAAKTLTGLDAEDFHIYCWVHPGDVQSHGYVPLESCKDDSAVPALEACARQSPKAYRAARLKLNLISCMAKQGWQRAWHDYITA